MSLQEKEHLDTMFANLSLKDKSEIDAMSLLDITNLKISVLLPRKGLELGYALADKEEKARIDYLYYRFEQLMAKEPIDRRDPQFMEKLNAHINEKGLNPFTGQTATESEKWLAKNYVLIKSSINTVQFVSTLSSTYIGYQSYYSKPIYGLHTDFLGKPKVYNRIELSKLNNTKNFTEKSIKHIF
ncbi:TPA: hypothetical protein U1C94_000986 [Streptococcus suis]|nr:hypothetical protein [Streptococcus suis]